MTKPRLLSNLPIDDLTSETDYLGIIDKGDLIKTFLIGNKDQFHEIKMFSLYGEWGSGKSSLMKYLEKELKADFNTFFFEAWEFEKDENLAMSLLEFITSKNIDPTEQICSDILKYGGRILRGLGKSIKLNIPLFLNGPSIGLDPSAFVEEVSKNEELTFYKALKNFKTEFGRLEDDLTKGSNPKYNIVFIDDLDRCEPEQVLNLLSAIKLFFTYGKKTIFFCGIDKKAVGQAIETKYGEIVKANEYLEKIFDISFSMPEHNDLLKLINVYFDDRDIKSGAFEGKLNEKITDFFNKLNFTNPRRLKKILNKYLILSSFKTVLKENLIHRDSMPNIYSDDEGNFFETILTLYFLCLYEYERDSFDIFNDMNFKRQALKSAVERFHSFSQKEISSMVTYLVGAIRLDDYTLELSSLRARYVDGEDMRRGGQDLESYKRLVKFYFLMQFIDGNGGEIGSSSFINGYSEFSTYYRVTTKKIDYFFSSYLIENFDDLIQQDNLSNFSLSGFKEMIGKFL